MSCDTRGMRVPEMPTIWISREHHRLISTVLRVVQSHDVRYEQIIVLPRSLDEVRKVLSDVKLFF